MADKLIVAPGCCVRYPSGVSPRGALRPVITQGQELPANVFTPSQIREHLKSKFVLSVPQSAMPDPASLPKSMPNRPGETVAPSINAGDPAPGGKGSDPVTISDQPTGVAAAGGIPDASDGGAGVRISPETLAAEAAAAVAPLSLAPPVAPVEQPVPGPKIDGAGSQVGPWIFNPADLVDKPLEELNVLIAERDPNVDAFTTVEEAIAYLSQNFVTE